MTVRKMVATLTALGVKVYRCKGGFAVYGGGRRVWCPDVDAAFAEGIDLVAGGL